MDLWPSILRHLETQDRMRVRLVCKAFSTLGSYDSICVPARSCQSKHSMSLLRFCSAQARLSEKGAMLELEFTDISYRYGHNDPRSLSRPCLYAALSCVNLCKLLLEMTFAKGEAELIVRLAPDGLQSLSLKADITLLGSSAWDHLQALTNLQLEAHERPAQPFHATALASLTNLQELAITGSEYGHTQCLDTSNVVMPNLCQLSLSWDPFAEPVSRSICPALRRLHILGRLGNVSDWILQCPIEILRCDSWEATLTNAGPANVHCKTAELVMPKDSWSQTGWQLLSLKTLLKLPALQCLHFLVSVIDPASQGRQQSPTDKAPAIILVGSRRKLRRLLKQVDFVFEAGVEVQLRFKAGDREFSVPIQENGHSILCACAICK